ncbi:putative polysaccharide biosynthesis protein [Salimicrobium humidisoli]|uniref:Polysaccharide biosynthesis/transport protein n=1 Tax=Salimicrobium humidisoli TaxID=2029857 RepID=A0ABX4HT81_9BACI|nr:polysaccharide biosynthesis protein [Salimicrobium humidisoli]PBB06439.1 polysaccharide biosynthesis/transport protein [Salimicrobium humidisoli]
MKTNGLMKGAVLLSASILLSKILGSFFRIPLQNIAGDSVLGIFSLVYPVYMVALTLSVAGIPLALSKLIAERESSREIRVIHRTANVLGALLGVSAFLIVNLFSSPLAAALGGPSTLPAIRAVSFALLFAPSMAVYRGYFQGSGDMKPTALSQVMEQIARVAVIIGAAYISVRVGLSASSTAGFVMTSSTVGVAASFIYLAFRYSKVPSAKRKFTGTYTLKDFRVWSKYILKISLPIAFGTLTVPLLQFVDAITIPAGLRADSNYLFGLYGRGLSLIQISTVFATAVIYPLLPAISHRLAAGDVSGVKLDIRNADRWNHLVSWPAACGFVVLALPLNVALFTDAAGTLVMAILGASSVFISFSIITTGILQGLGKGKQAAVVISTAAVLKLVLNLLLVPVFGLTGAAVINILVFALIYAGNTLLIKKNVQLRLVPDRFPQLLGSTVLAGVAMAVPFLFFSPGVWARGEAFLFVMISLSAGALVYAGSLLALRVVSLQELKLLVKR